MNNQYFKWENPKPAPCPTAPKPRKANGGCYLFSQNRVFVCIFYF